MNDILASAATPQRVPWRKVVVGVVVVTIVTLVVGVGGTNAIDEERATRFDEYRTRCTALPEGLVPAVSAGLTGLEGRTVDGVGLAEADGGRMLSVELRSPDLPRGSIGDIATFLVDDTGTEIWAVGSDAERYSTWPVADGVLVDDPGGVESRWCAADAGDGVLHN